MRLFVKSLSVYLCESYSLTNQLLTSLVWITGVYIVPSKSSIRMDGGSCFMPATTIESVKNTWISPPSSSTYHMPTYGSMQPNMMYGVVPPPQISFSNSWPSSNFLQSSWNSPPSHVISPYLFTLKILTTRI